MMVNCQFLLENVVKWFIYIYSTFVQVWPKGMKHHLFRTNNFHSAWRFLQFIFEHIYRHFSLHHGNKTKVHSDASFLHCCPRDCSTSELDFFWNLQAQVSQLLGPGLCFLLASKSGFSHLKHVSPSQGESVFPTHAETLLFSIPHQLVQVNSCNQQNFGATSQMEVARSSCETREEKEKTETDACNHHPPSSTLT